MAYQLYIQLLQRLRVPVSLRPGANKVALFYYITEAFLSDCMTDRKILNNQPVKRSKHLKLKFSSLIPV